MLQTSYLGNYSKERNINISYGLYSNIKDNKINNIINKYKEKDNNNKLNEMTIRYKINDNDKIIKLFGEEFVKNNKERQMMGVVINGQNYVRLVDIYYQLNLAKVGYNNTTKKPFINTK